MLPRYTNVLVVTVIMLTFPVLALPDTINVPGDYPTIQIAIDAVVAGDVVLVGPGTYVENLDFLGKAIKVRSSHGPEVTVVDGGSPSNPDYGSVVLFDKGEGTDSVLDGFTLTNGTGTDNVGNGYSWGGGVKCEGAFPTIRNNIINGNSASYAGAGIVCSGKTNISNNIISGNSVNYKGGGIYCHESGSPIITNNIITKNTAGVGSGVCCYYGCSPVITNNTITGNTADSGGGIYCWYNTSSTLSNNIFWNNNAAQGPEIWIGELGNPSTITISYSDVEGGKGSVYLDTGCNLIWGPGMIDTDPLFVDAANDDFHLNYTSACRDTGDNTVVTWAEDHEGDPRIAWGGTVDMGVDEFYNHLYVTGDTTPGGSIQGKFIGLPGTTPVGLFIGSGILSSPLSTMWGEFWLQAPWVLSGPLPSPIPSNGVMVLPTTLPGSIPAPYDVPMQALIGLNSDSLTNLCVLEVR